MADGTESDSPYDFAPKEPAATPPPITRGDPSSGRETPRRLENEAPEPLPDLAPRAPEIAPPAAAAEVSDEPLIERTCPHCGFRIIGKPRGGRCPECAAALDEVATDLLQFSDGRWLVEMSNGVLLLAASIIVQVLAFVLVWKGNLQIGNLLHAVAGIGAAAGVWMATASEPGVGLGRTPLAPFARMLAIAVAGLWVVAIFASPASSIASRAQALLTIIFLATAAQTIVVGLHLRMLAGRVPNDSLGGHLLNSSIVFAGVCVMMLALTSPGLAELPGPMFFFCVPLFGVIGGIVVWTLWAIIRIGLDLRNCAAAGQTIVARQALRAQAAADQAARR